METDMKNLKDRNFERELPSGYTQAMHVNAKNAKFGIVFNVIAVAVLLVVMAAAFILLALCDNDYRMSKRLFSFRQAYFIGFCIIKFQKI